MPAVAWFCIAPYVVWAALSVGHRFAPETFSYPPPPGIPSIDILALCFVLLGAYVGLISIAVMAPAIARERERETWETLRVSVSSRHDILLGLLVGRVGPILAAHFLAGLFWVLTRSHYASLLQRYSPFWLEQPALALLVWETLIAAFGLGCMAMAFSTYCRTTGLALVFSAAGFLLWTGTLVAAILVIPVSGPFIVLVWSVGLAILSYALAARGLDRGRAEG